VGELAGYDTWKLATPPEWENVGPEDEGYYRCDKCRGWFEFPEPCDCCCDVCGEVRCECLEIPEACAAYHEDNYAKLLGKPLIRVK
jgi:hypothetical protein